MSAFTEKFDSRKDAIVTMCYVLTTDLGDQGKKHYEEVLARKEKYSQPGEALTALAVMQYLQGKSHSEESVLS